MKASSWLEIGQGFDLNKAGIKIWGYDTMENLVCRLEINATGIEVFTGKTGRKRIADLNWEQLVKKLQA